MIGAVIPQNGLFGHWRTAKKWNGQLLTPFGIQVFIEEGQKITLFKNNKMDKNFCHFIRKKTIPGNSFLSLTWSIKWVFIIEFGHGNFLSFFYKKLYPKLPQKGVQNWPVCSETIKDHLSVENCFVRYVYMLVAIFYVYFCILTINHDNPRSKLIQRLSKSCNFYQILVKNRV